MTDAAAVPTYVNAQGARSVNDQLRIDNPESASVLMLPAHPTSVLIGRHAVLAWLHFAPDRYDRATVLLMATELLANALDYSNGPLVLTVSAGEDDRMRVEVQDASPNRGVLTAADVDRISDESRHLKMIRSLADCWGTELRLADPEAALRVVWFECRPIGAGRLPR